MKQKKIKFITHKEIWKILARKCIKSNKLSAGQLNFLKAVKGLTPMAKVYCKDCRYESSR